MYICICVYIYIYSRSVPVLLVQDHLPYRVTFPIRSAPPQENHMALGT